MTQHTPTPWKLSDGFAGANVMSETGTNVALALSEFTAPRKAEGKILTIAEIAEVKANAAFIVRACNAHDALVAEVEKAVALMEAAGIGYNEAGLRSALKLARGEG